MIKAMIKFFKNLWEKDSDYEFEIEFSIYDLIGLVAILAFIAWIIWK